MTDRSLFWTGAVHDQRFPDQIWEMHLQAKTHCRTPSDSHVGGMRKNSTESAKGVLKSLCHRSTADKSNVKFVEANASWDFGRLAAQRLLPWVHLTGFECESLLREEKEDTGTLQKREARSGDRTES